jgi:hypothetical protein
MDIFSALSILIIFSTTNFSYFTACLMQNPQFKNIEKKNWGIIPHKNKRIAGKNINTGICLEKVRGKIPHGNQCALGRN